jgi:hypothetical protein
MAPVVGASEVDIGDKGEEGKQWPPKPGHRGHHPISVCGGSGSVWQLHGRAARAWPLGLLSVVVEPCLPNVSSAPDVATAPTPDPASASPWMNVQVRAHSVTATCMGVGY